MSRFMYRLLMLVYIGSAVYIVIREVNIGSISARAEQRWAELAEPVATRAQEYMDLLAREFAEVATPSTTEGIPNLLPEPEPERAAPVAETLLEATAAGDQKRARELIAQGVEVNDSREDGTTALMSAVSNGQTKLAELLIERGALVDARAKGGWTALMYAARYGQVDAAQLLIDRGSRSRGR